MRWIVTAFLLAGCAARPYVRLAREHHTEEEEKVALVLHDFMLPDQQPWKITLLESDSWWRKLSHYSRGNPRSAEGSGFTVPEWHHTYLNSGWVQSATNENIARVLAHEWGHIVCVPRCDDDEQAATNAGAHILRMKAE